MHPYSGSRLCTIIPSRSATLFLFSSKLMGNKLPDLHECFNFCSKMSMCGKSQVEPTPVCLYVEWPVPYLASRDELRPPTLHYNGTRNDMPKKH